ncbi:polysaccharide biosynthesis protein [Mizugakiibacter sediminis]|uniref:Polysaccharide biosynthesis protein n=1 Tax=Mizugakiibacter sediminis TaxID=1475481 RepID=A0A0K8QNS4_9GAMM|nr:polysaccharide biosynthesis protein [Mizugakiibacter sediminis]GAP66361.1 polysaccharide biosynthesis protein [Mizugakiibacter sediminis]
MSQAGDVEGRGAAVTSLVEGERRFRLAQTSREMIARMREPEPRPAQELDRKGLLSLAPQARRFADVFRDLRTQLIARHRGENFSVMVAPVTTGAGASFVAANLALAFALDEAKTALLIDCNLREPSQDRRLGVAVHAGLTDFLDDPGIGIEHIIYPSGIPRLRLIPVGTHREGSSEYLSSMRMRALLAHLKERYPDRYLVLNAPALDAAPDARVLGELTDCSVAVVGYGQVTAEAVRDAVSALDPARFAGLVFNNVP